jgi:hypothetical protein
MAELGALVDKVRSKNAGPFWITVDIFCGSPEVFARVAPALGDAGIAAALDTPLQTLKRFDIPDLSVIKVSFPRPQVQGSPADRDMHGASWAVLLAEMEIA